MDLRSITYLMRRLLFAVTWPAFLTPPLSPSVAGVRSNVRSWEFVLTNKTVTYRSGYNLCCCCLWNQGRSTHCHLSFRVGALLLLPVEPG
jgi:hypothetical protein